MPGKNMRKKFSPLMLGLALNAAFSSLPAEAEAATSAPSPAVTAHAFRIRGSHAFSEAQLLKLIQADAGKPLTREQLVALADRITRFYHRHGYMRAHATLPQQSFSHGLVRFWISTDPRLPTMPATLLASGTAPEYPASGVPAAVPASSILVRKFRVQGSHAFSESRLLKLVAGDTGKRLTLDQLAGLADRITAFYHRRGYARAHAVIPQQDFADGTVRFWVTTGNAPVLPATAPPSPPQASAETAAAEDGDGIYVSDIPPLLTDFSKTPGSHGDPVQVLLEHAKWWEARDRIDLAQQNLNKLFSVRPHYPPALVVQARLQIRGNQPKQAQATLDELRKAQPDSPEIARMESLLRTIGPDKAELRQARQLAEAGRYPEAIALFDKLFPAGPPSNDLTLEYWQMVENTHGGRYRAHKGIAKLARDNPYNLHYQLALAALETSRLPVNRRALQVIIDMSRMPAYSDQARRAWRSAMLTLDDSPSSLPLLHHYLSTDPGDSAVRNRRDEIARAVAHQRELMADPNYRAGIEGLALLDKGQLDAAEPLLQQALHAYPKDSDLVGGIGMLKLRRGQDRQAELYFDQAIRLTKGASKWRSLATVSKFWALMHEARDARKAQHFILAEEKLNAALQVKHNDPDAIAELAAVQADRGFFDNAAATYRRALSIDPMNSAALEGLIDLYREQGQQQEMQQAIAQLTPAQRKVLGSKLDRMQADALQAQAGRLAEQGHDDEAMARLERAVTLTPDDPWLRFTLAKLYARHGSPQQGQALFDDLLARHPDDPDALYAMAQYQSDIDQSNRALATLAAIPPSQRSAKSMRLWGINLERIADAYAQAGQKDEAEAQLRKAEEIAGHDEEAGIAVALAWGKIGDYDQADRLFDTLRTAHTPASVSWHLGYAQYLAMQQSPALPAELDTLASMQLSPDERRELYALQESHAIRMASAQLASGSPGQAHQTLAPFLQQAPDRIPLLLADAQAYQAEQQWPAAESIYRHVLQLEPENTDARGGLIDSLVATGDNVAALRQLDIWNDLTTQGNVSARLQLADMYLKLDAPDIAQVQLDTLVGQYPDNARVLNHAWKAAQNAGRPDEGITYLQKSLAATYAEQQPAAANNNTESYKQIGFDPLGSPKKIHRSWEERSLAALIDRRTDWLSSAMDIRSRSGTAGLSQFQSVEIPAEYRTPWHANDEVFVRTDIVSVDAGSAASTNTDFGSQLLCQPNCSNTLSTQSAHGLGFTAGYRNDKVRADLGVTPLNFAVTNVVGGVRYDGDIGKVSYALEALRRPLTSSLLSYAGTIDPRTGQAWGGVVKTGGRLGLSLDQGGTFGFWSSFGLYDLTGRNVQTNQRIEIMAGEQWRIINRQNRLLSLGVTGMYWHHTRDAGEYTFGQGGYYSPQYYRSLSLPVTFGERYPRFSYALRGSVSLSQAYTQSTPYYPTDAAMQAQAGNPIYTGGPSGNSTGYTLEGIGEYQLDQQLFLGGQFAIVRSINYSPNELLFYLRYSMDQPAAQPVHFLPKPVIPSSQF